MAAQPIFMNMSIFSQLEVNILIDLVLKLKH